MCAFTGCRLHLIHPLGFVINDRNLRRAGMDYWKSLDVHEHADWAQFRLSPHAPRRLWLFTTHGERSFWDAPFADGDGLLFGNEGEGSPAWLHEEIGRENRLVIPQVHGAAHRSLNLSTAAGIAYAYLPDYKRSRPDVYAEAATLEALAGRIGADPATLAVSVQQHNEAIAAGRTETGLTIFEPNEGLDEGPVILQKRVEIGLTYIYGIGRSTAQSVCKELGIESHQKVRDLTEDEVTKLRDHIDAQYQVEGDLRREVAADIRRKVEIGCYQGIRHRKGLPVRGQRTHTNARTRKGPRVAIAGKKKETK